MVRGGWTGIALLALFVMGLMLAISGASLSGEVGRIYLPYVENTGYRLAAITPPAPGGE